MELIKIEEKEGRQFISSLKEIYIGAGMDKSQWSRWTKSNIIKNSFFQDGKDYESFDIMSSKDYRCTLDMGKHLIMQMRTEKAHEYRDYLIKCEKKLVEIKNNLPKLTEMEMIAKIATSQSKTIERIDSLELKFDTVLTLESHKQRNIQKAISKRVYERSYQLTHSTRVSKYPNGDDFTEKETKEAIKIIRSCYFSNIHRELKNKFGVTSYKDIKVVQYEDALIWIGNWIEDAGVLD